MPGGPELSVHLPMLGVWDGSLVGELRSHMPHGEKKTKHKKQKQYCHKFNEDFKMVHIKKSLLKGKNASELLSKAHQ